MATQYKAWLGTLRETLLTDKSRSRGPDFTALREVTPALVAADKAAYWKALDALGEPKRAIRKTLRFLVERDTARGFSLTPDGARARQRIQTLLLQY